MTDSDSDLDKGTGDSSSQGDQQSSKEAPVTRAEFDKVLKTMQQLESLQRSEKDRGIQQVKAELTGLKDDLKPVLERAVALIASGKSADAALEQISSEEDEKDFRKTVRELAKGIKGDSKPSEKDVNVAEVIEQFKLDPADARVAEFANKKFSSKEEALLAGGHLAVAVSTSAKPDEASRASLERGVPKSKSELEKLADEYKQRSAKLRGNELINLKQEMRKKGLPIN